MSEWQPVSNWEEYYEVSSDGRVRKIGGDDIGSWSNDQGYKLVRLSGGGRRVMKRVHRLVAEAFCLKTGGNVVNHIDHNRSNNVAENLEWCTQQHNLAHARNAGRMVSHWVGKKGPNASLTDDQVRACREMRGQGLSYSNIAKAVGTTKRTAQRIVREEHYSHVR